MIGATETITVGVSDLPNALKLFRDTIGLREERRYDLSPSLAQAWQLPSETRAQFVELSAEGYPIGRLRLAVFDPKPTQLVRHDHGPGAFDSALDVGPKAIDFYVRDPIGHAMEIFEKAGYHARSPAVRHVIGNTESEELLYSGPDELPILLMVGHRHRPEQLRTSWTQGDFSEIATISVCTGDLDASRRFYGETLGLTVIDDDETQSDHRTSVNDLTGTPAGARIHFLLYGAAGEPSGKILIVHFFEQTGKRLTGRMRPGNLGFSLLSHRVVGLDAALARVIANGFEVITPAVEVDRGGENERIALIEGPNEELLELVESA